MTELLEAIVAGISAFIATNLDDIVILLLFFSQVNDSFRRRHIVAGQYLGFTGIILVSLPGFIGGQFIPPAWIGLMGLLPIGIGLHHLLHPEDDEDEVVQTVTPSSKQRLAHIPILAFLVSLLNPYTYQVAAVTFANGGDNVGIYVPLFASSDFSSLLIILAVFYVMTAVECYVAYQLVQHPKVAAIATRYGHAIVPYVLIALGIYILWENGTLALFWSFLFG